MHGSDDPLVPPEAGKDTAANIREAKLLIVDGMGHDLPPPLFDFFYGARHSRLGLGQGEDVGETENACPLLKP